MRFLKLVCFTAVTLSFLNCAGGMSQKASKLGYVNKNSVIQKYEVAQNVRNTIGQNTKVAQTEVDKQLQKANEKINRYNEDLKKAQEAKNEQRIKELTELIQMTAGSFENQKKTMQDKLTVLNEAISQKVLDTIDQFITDYGRKNGYSIIFDSSTGILYKDEAIDLTKEITAGLNTK